MKYSLDTNTCINYMNGRSSSIVQKLKKIPAKDIVVCSIVRSELFYGSYKSPNPTFTRERQNRFLQPYLSLPFDDTCADMYGMLRAQLASSGMLIGPLDLQIATIAMVNNLILVTHNIREFSRISGLKIEDWQI